MEKLELKSGEQIEIEDGASENSIKVAVKSVDAFKALYEKFTDNNLSEVSFYNESGVVCAIYKDKTLASAKIETTADIEAQESRLIATFNLKVVDSTKQELKSLRETVNTLILLNLEVE